MQPELDKQSERNEKIILIFNRSFLQIRMLDVILSLINLLNEGNLTY